MRKKIFLFSGIVFVIITSVFGYFYYQKIKKGHPPAPVIYTIDYKEEKIPKWVKYANDKIGVLFKYPEFNVNDRYTRKWSPRATSGCVGFTSTDGNKIFVHNLPYLSEFYICLSDSLSECEKQNGFLNKEEYLESNNFKGFKTKELNNLEKGEIKWCIFNDERVYSLRHKWVPDEEEFEYRDQIINSVEFFVPKSETEYNEITTNTVWKIYKNDDLGVEFEYPTTAFAYDHYWDGNYDKCEGSGERKEISVPYKIFVSGKDIFIKEEYYYAIDSEGNCQKIFNTTEAMLERYKNNGNFLPPWDIRIINIEDEKELADYIVKNFGWGGGCSLGDITETKQVGVFDVTIKQDGTDLGNTTCGVNYKYYLKYIPDKHKLIRWSTGQECIIGRVFGDCFDEKIVNSMKF